MQKNKIQADVLQEESESKIFPLSKAELIEKFKSVRVFTEEITDPLEIEDFVVQLRRMQVRLNGTLPTPPGFLRLFYWKKNWMITTQFIRSTAIYSIRTTFVI